MTKAESSSGSPRVVTPGTHACREAAGSGVRATAFVLSGGASLAAAQVGMLEALYERGIAPDFLVGTSAGALNAAFVASRPQTPSTATKLGRIWRDLRREDVFPLSLAALVGGMAGRRDHLVSDRGLRQLVYRYLEFDDLADAPIPLHLVAFDLTEGSDVALCNGPALDSITASASIPGIYPPVKIGKRRLVDGGVLNNTPVSHAVALGAERIYVLPAQYPCRPPDLPAKSALDAAMYAVGVLIGSRLEADIVQYSRDVELIVMPPPETVRVQPTSFEHSSALIAEALAAARGMLSSRSGPPHLRLVRDGDDGGRPRDLIADGQRLRGALAVGPSTSGRSRADDEARTAHPSP